MCFSPAASFTAAALTGAIGLVALARTPHPRQLPLAAMPLVFAAQQAIEGALWVSLPASPAGAVATGLALAFLLIAKVFWPVFAPLAVLLVEPGVWRRRLILACLALGAVVAAHELLGIAAGQPGARIVAEHIVYGAGGRATLAIKLAYLAAVSLPLLLSSARTLNLLGAIILAGSVIAYVFYWEAFVSVWCFFAAAASVALLIHVELARRQAVR